MSETEAPIIDCRNLTKRYGANTAVEAFDWQIAPGTVTGLLGANGAGKTTTLQMLVDLVSPTRGEARIFGKLAAKLNSSDFARLGYVAESQELPDWMTIEYLLNYLKPMYPTWDDAFSQRLLDLFDLPRDRKISELSRGMRMKAAFVSSLAYRPELLILDELFGGLDPVVREDLIDALLELTTQERWTIVVSSHDLDDIERLLDHVAILNHGRLLLHVPIESIQARFRSISFRSHHTPSKLPEHWLGYDADQGRVQLVDTAFEEGETLEKLRAEFPDLEDVAIDPMTLKAAYIALMRARRDHSEPQRQLVS